MKLNTYITRHQGLCMSYKSNTSFTYMMRKVVAIMTNDDIDRQ